ncbi:MAG: MCP four helix bundle domain-containing protein, partial [Bacteroidia bacterium]
MNSDKKKWSFKIDKKIYLLFFALILIALANAIVSTYTIEKSKRITNEIEEVTNPSLAQLLEMNQLVTKSRMYIANWVYLRNSTSDKENLVWLNQETFPHIKNKLLSLTMSWNNAREVDQIKKVFADYEKLVYYENQIMRELVTFDDYQDPIKKFTAEEIIETQIIPKTQTIIEQLSKITEQKKTEAAIKQNEMLLSFSLLSMVVIGLATLIIISVITVTFFMSKNIIAPVMKMREIILQMSMGELPSFELKTPKNAVGEMVLAIGHLMNGLRRTSRFAKEIGTGNFSSHFEPLSPNDVQGKALIEMRDRLKSANESDA